MLFGSLTLCTAPIGTEARSSAPQHRRTFTNPVIHADVPDVDVIRVGEDYYMVSTTAHMSPGAPIMHSENLVDWKIIGYVFDKLNESPRNDLIGGNIYSRGQWAPCLRYHNGLFHVFFGTGNKSYLYTAADPAGKWDKRAEIDEYLHDASLLFDDNGKVYLAYGSGKIRIVQFNEELSAIDPEGLNIEVIHGNPPGLLEGTHFYKYGNTYYLTLIWWPQGGIRTQLCFRSERVEGPYEMKTILSDDLGFPGHGVAQGCLIDTPQGDWYAMLFQDHEAVGRVPVLMPCHWKNGWPMLGDANGKVPVEMEVPISKQHGNQPTALTVSDDFETPTLGLTWQWNHNPDNTLWSLSERPGFLRLKTDKTVQSIFEARNTLTQRTEGPGCQGVAVMDVAHMKEGDHAGLAAFCAETGTIEVIVENGRKYLVMTDREKETARTELTTDRIFLRMECNFTTDTARFSYSTDGEEWISLGNTFHMVFNMVHFTGNKFALFNYATETSGGYVDIDCFQYERTDAATNGDTH